VHRLHELMEGPEPSGEQAMVAALVIDVVGIDPDPADVASLLAQLAVPDPAPVQHLLSSSTLLRAAAADLDSYERAELRQVATHLGSLSVAHGAYLLAVACETSLRQRPALDELAGLIEDLLRHPELLGEGADSLAAGRRIAAEALVDEPRAVERLRAADASYLLANEPTELARQARLVEPLPEPGAVRAAVSPEGRPDHWLIDVACRDHDGLLARLARALTAAGCDIVSATVATWPDGAAVDTFLVRSAVRPQARALAMAMEEGLRHKLVLQPVDDLEVSFDNTALPWHTTSTIEGPDRPGTLAASAAAFAAAGVVVHSARVASDGGRVIDRFALSDRHGRKLDDAAIARVEAALGGTRPRRSLLRNRR
jgi:UTP:GlnB (protein PII) uridylyltransferase